MPSKYSHSVVLAQQSSHGLISLPNDQYINYLRSSPLLTTKPPPRTTSALPKNRARAASAKNDDLERLAAQRELRQQPSRHQVSGDADQQYSTSGRLHQNHHRLIFDSDEEDDEEFAESRSQASHPSKPPSSSARSADLTPRHTKLPPLLPVEVHQQVVRNGILLPFSQTPRRADQRMPLRPTPTVSTSNELPASQVEAKDFAATATKRKIPSPLTHGRDTSEPKCLATPQLSPTGSETTHQDDSPTTPSSGLQRVATPARTEESDSFSRSEPSFSPKNRINRIYKPALSTMPSEANFDGFQDGEYAYGGTALKHPRREEEARNSRLDGLRAYQDMVKEINDSPKKENFSPSSNRQGAAYDESSQAPLSPPSSSRYHDRGDSLSSRASSKAFGDPSVSQTTGQPKTSAAAMLNSPTTAHEALYSATATFAPQKAAPSSTYLWKKQIRPMTSPGKRQRQEQQGPSISHSHSGTKASFRSSAHASGLFPFPVPPKPTTPQQPLSPTADSLLTLPSIIPDSPFKRAFDPSLFESSASFPTLPATDLTRVRFSFDDSNDENDEEDEDGDFAAPPPDIARRPQTRHGSGEPAGAEVYLNSRGIMSVVDVSGHARTRSKSFATSTTPLSFGGVGGLEGQKKGGLFATLRLKGRKW